MITIAPGQTLAVTERVVDLDLTRPAYLVMPGGRLILEGGLVRGNPDRYEDSEGLRPVTEIIPGFRPSASWLDVCRAGVVLVGDGASCVVQSFDGEVGVVCLPNPDGSLGRSQRACLDCAQHLRYGIMFAGTSGVYEALDCQLWVRPDGPPGHVVYANEAWLDGRYLNSQGCTVDVSGSLAHGEGRSDWFTVKLKGARRAQVFDTHDHNPWGAFDSVDSDGVYIGDWSDKDGQGQNPVACAFRTTYDQWGSGRRFGVPTSPMTVRGTFQVAGPRTDAPAYRSETPLADLKWARVAGGGAPVVWDGCPRAATVWPRARA